LDYNEQAKVDLHIHSAVSDGTCSPSEILTLAQNLNIAAIAITDHDTIDGSKDALAHGIPPSVQFLTGVEISASPPPSFPCYGSLHILGYSIRLDDPVLNETLGTLREARETRNPQIIERLNTLGVDISLNEVQNEVGGGGQLGRPHIARLMVKKGFAQSIDEAFDNYLGTGKPAYVDKYRVACDRAIEIILGAGGVPVLAHPILIKFETDGRLEDLILILKKMGLMGIEVYYPDHTPENTALYIEIAKRHQLLITGGTDFHGALKPEIEIGSGKGDFHVPYETYEKLVRQNKRDQADLSEFETKLSYTFKDQSFLEEALRHSSFVNEQPDTDLRDNERLEFLGDAVLNLVAGHILMLRYPNLNEGDLTRIRASFVNETQLAAIAHTIDLGFFIQLGKGEDQTNGRQKKSILADTFEAVIAAVYLDGGVDAAQTIINTLFAALLDSITASAENLDYKSRLQETVQATHKAIPSYTVIHESGPDHDKTFKVQLDVLTLRTQGAGKSKKTAEQNAARKALEILSQE